MPFLQKLKFFLFIKYEISPTHPLWNLYIRRDHLPGNGVFAGLQINLRLRFPHFLKPYYIEAVESHERTPNCGALGVVRLGYISSLYVKASNLILAGSRRKHRQRNSKKEKCLKYAIHTKIKITYNFEFSNEFAKNFRA